MNKIQLAVMGLFLFLVLNPVRSFASNTMESEINHLLEFVSRSGCEYVRNGSRYNAEKARKHIEKKYHYFSDEIDSAEKFIEYSATKSTLSGKFYQVVCHGKTRLSSEWLLQELSVYRKNQTAK